MNFLLTSFKAFKELTSTIICYRQLSFEMARRELSERYSGQFFGIFWSILHPIFLMCLYVFVFAFVFKQKIGGTLEMPLDYTTYLLSGLVAWLAFQESLAKSCTLITGNANLVKQVVFPLEVLPVKSVLSSLFTQFITLSVLLAYILIRYGYLPITTLLLPFLVFIQIIFMIGTSFMLSSLGAYFRDIKDFVQLFAISGLYIMPIFYLPNMVPSLFKPILYLNPFSYLIWAYQDVLYFGYAKHPYAWPILILISLFSYILGYRMFRRLKTGFGNVL